MPFRILHPIIALYPLWLLLTAIAGFLHPPLFLWFSGRWIIGGLILVMFGMGMTLNFSDFRNLFKMPGPLALGFLIQYTLMPLAGWGLAQAFHLEPGLAIGLILVASCPDGTASNLLSYLAQANVALAVALTILTTLFACLITPLWCDILAGQSVSVDTWGIGFSTVEMVIVPVFLGVLIHWKFPKTVAKIAPYGPLLSALAIALIAGSIVATHANSILHYGLALTLATTLLHVIGFVFGYGIPRLFGYSKIIARTLSIEVSVQNGGMATVLAKKHFLFLPTAPLPAVFSSILQTLLGACLATYWKWKNQKEIGKC